MLKASKLHTFSISTLIIKEVGGLYTIVYLYVEEYRLRNYIKLSLVLKNVRYNEL